MKSIENYLDGAYQLAMDNYLVICTVFFILVMTFVLPDLVNKINSNKEFKSIKKIVKEVSNEVTRAEVACLAAAGEICYLHCSMHDDATETDSKPDIIKAFAVSRIGLAFGALVDHRYIIISRQSSGLQDSKATPSVMMVDEKVENRIRIVMDLSVCTSPCLRSTRSEPIQEVALMSYVYTHSFDALKPNSTESVM